MVLFQKSVLTNYLKSITDDEINSGWEKIQDYQKMSSKIREFKEEAFQAGFLTKIFVDCLGYKSQYDSADEGNLFFEEKNVSDGKKADGAIKKDNAVVLVIELKGTNTKDLKSVETQAFGYKANHPKCEYVVTSNFEKLRFYIENAVNYEEFDLFNLSKEDYRLLHLCLHSDNLFNGIPKKLKNESVLVEESITKKLYKDYSAFRNEIFNSLVETNSEYDKLLLFNKTQKLLDRFLFIFFAEDRNLVPANSISKIISKWEGDVAFGESRSLYSIFKQYFSVLNIGRPAKGEHESIFAYNGGLFAEDEVLDKIEVDDGILLKHTKNLSHYDFESDISVNILGHIFEHSLSEIEEIQNEIAGIETGTSKRKKDGVFYTPPYITKYIIENTLGKLCLEKKAELEINEEVYTQHKARSQKRIDNLNAYREWLLQLTICDPACGSGAFLVQALNFLIEEHKYIDELNAGYHGASIPFSNITSSILENNLFGVDINEESVEIAKLSLWLRTAQKGRKLTSLNSNLKCGNSLIDDPEVAGDRAFNWQNEFPEVFKKGGFDVLIGNPPYVSYQSNSISEKDLKYFNVNYQSSHKIFDLYGLFIEKSYSLLNDISTISFIIPNLFLMNDSFTKLRCFIAKNFAINQIVNCEDGIFEDAVVPTAIFVFEKGTDLPLNVDILSIKKKLILNDRSFEYDFFVRSPEDGFNLKLDKPAFQLLNKFELSSTKLGKILHIRETIKTGNDKEFISGKKHSADYYPMVTGKDVSKYRIFSNKFLYFNKEKLSRPTKLEYYKVPKLFIRRVGKNVEAAYDDQFLLSTHVLYIGSLIDTNFNLKYVLALLNSPFFTKIYHLKFPPKGKVFPEIRIGNLRELPVKNLVLKRQLVYESFVNDIIKNQDIIEKRRHSFCNYILSKYTELPSSNKVLNWNNYLFNDLLKEFNKSKIELDPTSEIKLLNLFEEYTQEISDCQLNIDSLKIKIDDMIINDYEIDSKELIIFKS